MNSSGPPAPPCAAGVRLKVSQLVDAYSTSQLPDETRITAAIGVVCPLLFGTLFLAACCMKPRPSASSGGRDSRERTATERWRDCGSVLLAFLLVAFLSFLSIGVTLYIVSYELEGFPDSEVEVQFCEAKFGGLFRAGDPVCPGGICPESVYLPEWGSTLSAVFIVYCGMHMLYFWVHDSAMLRLIASMFCVNGVASFFYHMTNLRSWGLTDGNTMLFLVWVVVAYMWDEFIETLAVQCSCFPTWNQVSRSELGAEAYWCVFARRAFSAVVWVTALAGAWWLMFSEVTTKTTHAIAIAVPLLVLVFFAVVLTVLRPSCRKRRRAKGGPHLAKGASGDDITKFAGHMESTAVCRLWLGVVLAALAALCWIVTEELCCTVDFFKVFPVRSCPARSRPLPSRGPTRRVLR